LKFFLGRIFVPVLFWTALFPGSAVSADVRLVVSGVKGALRKNIEAALQLPSGLVRDGQTNRRWLERLLQKAPADARKALEPLGYYHVQVKAELVEVRERKELRVQVDPGEPVRLGRVRVVVTGPGAERLPLRRMVAGFPLKRGDQLNHKVYEDAKLALRVGAVDLGYLKAKYRRSKVEVDVEAYRADIDLELETGPLFYFGEISIEGAESFPPDFLRRYVEFSSGDIFSNKQLNRTRINFLKADRFDDIQLVPEIELARRQLVPIRIRLKEGARRRLRTGVGYGTNTGARLTLNYQELNLWQRAHRFEADFSLAQKTQALIARYTIPLSGHKENSWGINAGLSREDIDVYETEIIHLEGERVYGLGSDAVISFSLRQQREDYTIGRRSDISTLLLPGIRYQRRHYDDPVNPNRGFQYRLELTGSHDALLSDSTLLRFTGGGALMQPLGEDWTLLLRSYFGLLAHDGDFNDVPVSMRFFVGGDNGVRGYAYKSRGATDETGRVIGGDGLAGGSLEVEYAFSKRYGAAIFYDAGSAFMAFQQVRFIQGAGVGARVYTPVGPIKLDLARQLHEPNPGWRIHFSVGFDL